MRIKNIQYINNIMKAKVLQFPEKTPSKPEVITGYRLSFYEEGEIDLALLCLNTFGFTEVRYSRQNLKSIDPIYIRDCMIRAYNSELLSTVARETIIRIIDSMEEFPIAVH